MKVQSEREKVMKEIYQDRKDQLAKEASEIPGEVIEAEIEAEAQPEAPQDAAPETPPEVTPEPEAPEAPKIVKAKVDDVEYDVPQEEIDKAGSLALWQIQKASENRLKKLNETIKQLEAQRQPAPQVPPQQDHDAELMQQLEVLRYGEPAQALQILKQLKTPPQVPVDQITEAAARRVEWDSAAKAFIKENEDLLQDPDIQVVAIARETQLKQYMQQTKQWPDIARFYKDLGTQLRAKYGKPATVDLEARREQKETIAEPKAASGRVPTPQPPKPKTTADIVNDMRKARGQPVH